MEDHREKDKRVEEDAMRRFFNGPCSTMTEAEEIEAELHTRIKELEAQLKAAEARVKELEQGFREVLVCARNISEGYYEDAALLGRIARSFVGVKNDQPS